MLWELGARAGRQLTELWQAKMVKRSRRTLVCNVVVSVCVGGLLLGAVLAAHPGMHHQPKGRPMSEWNPLKPAGPKQLLIVFAIDEDGNVEANYRNFGSNPGTPTTWQYLPTPLATVNIDVRIGNPKVCWTTTTGDRQCVVY